MARLILTYNNKVLSNHFVAPGKQLTIGRDSKNQISINHSAVSQKHAKIVHDEKGLHLSDLGSTNGTLVNGERVSSCQLVHQDWVVIGKHLIVVDLYETLSLEVATQMLEGKTSGVAEADGTVMLNVGIDQSQTRMQRYYSLSFMSEQKGDFELSDKPVSIGKNKDADIKIKGLWSFLSGEPAARIEKHSGDYYLEYLSGMLKPKVNNQPLHKPAKLRNHDVIKIGPLKLQVNCSLVNLSTQ
jgi:predicted component of type VI protein secretion system